jgi:DNA-binding XRE family transcriptional regulator
MNKLTAMAAGMTPRKLRGTLVEHNINQAEIGRTVGVSRVLVTYVVYGKKYNLKVRLEIARRLGIDVRDIWPNETRHLKKGD